MTHDGPRSDLTAVVLGRALVGAARFERAAAQHRERWRSFLCGLFSAALDAEELEALTVDLYGIAPGRYGSRSLFDWEAALFERELPPPPARVLVTAAGSGREIRALLERGYAVDALEPVPSMAAACAAVPGVGAVVTGTHRDLIDSVEGLAGAAAALAARRYDAVVVGWGSLTHILSRDEQHRLLAACDRLAPSGPVLVSFFASGEWSGRRPRAFEAGARLGRALATRRGIAAKDVGIGFAWHLGFTHAYAPGEIEELAAGVGRTAVVVTTPYGHAALRPGRSP